MERVRVGTIGCGKISGQYLDMAKNFPLVEMVSVADLHRPTAEAAAEQYGIPKVDSVEGLLADSSIELVLNLTIPAAHVPLAIAALEHGKHTYLEKPLGVDRDDARKLVETSRQTGLRVGCAPDTFLGSHVQTARAFIDEGGIGRPVGFMAFNMGRGHESWHPSPEFYYEPGGGPMLDMGPYYLTALLQLLGPIRRVAGMSTIAIPSRTITSEPKRGKTIDVKTDDHVCGTVEFVGGCVGTIVTSFATHPAGTYDRQQPITIFGTEGTLKVGDPNNFDKCVSFCPIGKTEFEEVPNRFVTGYGRSVGLADMAHALRKGRPHRCSLEQAFVVLDAMQGFLEGSKTGRFHEITLDYERPAAMDGSLPYGELD